MSTQIHIVTVGEEAVLTQSGAEYDTFRKSSDLSEISVNEQIYKKRKDSTVQSQCTYGLSLLLTKLSQWSTIVKPLYYFIIVNLILMVLFLNIVRYLHKEWIITKLFPNSAPLGTWYFQVANIFLLLSYCSNNLFYLRILLFFGCLFFGLWCAFYSGFGLLLDGLLYNICMIILNIQCFVELVWKRRHVDFESDFENLYQHVFCDFMLRPDFEYLVKAGLVRSDTKGAVLRKENALTTSLRVLIEGEVELLRQNEVFNVKGPFEILEAPEWSLASNLNPEFTRSKITMRSRTAVKYVKWPRETLVELLCRRPQLISPLRAVLGIETAKTLWKEIEGDSMRSVSYSNLKRSPSDSDSKA